MAANKAQGRGFGTFIVGFTVACAGISQFSSGLGKLLAVVGGVIVLISLFSFLKIKPLEGKVPKDGSPLGMKLLGAFVAWLGWVVVLVGLHFVTGNGGRIALALVGICVTLFGILYILPTAFNRNAIWKA